MTNWKKLEADEKGMTPGEIHTFFEGVASGTSHYAAMLKQVASKVAEGRDWTHYKVDLEIREEDSDELKEAKRAIMVYGYNGRPPTAAQIALFYGGPELPCPYHFA